MPGARRHSKKFDRCVREVKRSGTAASPYAVCQKSVGNPKRKGKMPAGLARYWRAKRRAKRARRNPGLLAATLASQNPRGFVITARRRGKTLYYDGKGAFRHTNPHRYRAHADAAAHAKTLREAYKRRLSAWRVGVARR
jgi:hypothetical protein